MTRLMVLSCVLSVCGMSAANAAKPQEYREGKQLYKQGKYAAALGKLRLAAKKAPRVAATRYLMGLALTKLGRHIEAEAALLEAKRLDPAIGFTSLAKFQGKLAKAKRNAAAVRGAKTPQPTVAQPLARPAPRPPEPAAAAPLVGPGGASAATVSAPPSPPPARGAPLWSMILLGVSGGFLGLSLLRELMLWASRPKGG